MTLGSLIVRSLRYRWRDHLGVALGATIAGTALTGALIVGDSVRGSLRDMALSRLGKTHFALTAGDQLFMADLARRIQSDTNDQSGTITEVTAALALPGTAATRSGLRANRVQVLGVDGATWPGFAGWNQAFSPGQAAENLREWRAGETAAVNGALAGRLNLRPGDELVMRVKNPALLAQDVPVAAKRDDSRALTVRVGPVLPGSALADFNLTSGGGETLNIFMPLDLLSRTIGTTGQANLVLAGEIRQAQEPELKDAPTILLAPAALTDLAARLRRTWRLEDVGVRVRSIGPQSGTNRAVVEQTVEIHSPRVFLPRPVAEAAAAVSTNQAGSIGKASHLTTYLANLLRKGERAAPYSMVTAAEAPFVPADMGDDEILINQWLADDLQAAPGDVVEMSYFLPEIGPGSLPGSGDSIGMPQRTNAFRVRAIVPMEGRYADRTLMPEFPGLADAERTSDWDIGFPLVYKIRNNDETYWDEWRGTPKAFITLRTGKRLWGSRFGDITAIRYPVPDNTPPEATRRAVYDNLRASLDPGQLGLRFQASRAEALSGASQAQDFGQLFLGFSLFLVGSALLLMALLFRFGLERRVSEIGTFLALGFTANQVRKSLLAESAVLAAIGGGVGALGGTGYARAMIWGLTTTWRGAIGHSALTFHVRAPTWGIGFAATCLVCCGTLWLALRKYSALPPHTLLTGEIHERDDRRFRWITRLWLPALAAALGLSLWQFGTVREANPAVFFGVGALVLLSGIGFLAARLGRREAGAGRIAGGLGFSRLAIRNTARQPTRSLATVALLGAATFLIVSIGAFRLEAGRGANRPQSGTGGFELIGESTLPIVPDLNTRAGRETLGLSEEDMAGVSVIGFRTRDGDEASCLNLNRSRQPRLLGAPAEWLKDRFTFVKAAPGLDAARGWDLLQTSMSADEVPAIGDANSVRWAMGKAPGDAITMTDEQGRAFQVRIVGTIANSVLQGQLVLDEAVFLERFPGTSGRRFFLVDSPDGATRDTAAALVRGLQDYGFDATPAVERLNAFNAVQNTYLSTFQALGGIGLLLGSAGLGIVLLRNLLERRGELGAMIAVGFRLRQVSRMLLVEHAVLLLAGLALGAFSGVVAILPALVSRAQPLPWTSLALTLAAVLVNGLLFVWLGARYARGGDLLAALRND